VCVINARGLRAHMGKRMGSRRTRSDRGNSSKQKRSKKVYCVVQPSKQRVLSDYVSR